MTTAGLTPLTFTLLSRAAGVAYVLYVLASDGPVATRLFLAAVASTVVVTCHRWRAFTLFATPFLIHLAVYDRQRLLSPAITNADIDVTGPRNWELAWFGAQTSRGVVTPPEWFQSHTSVVLDVICGLVYLGFMPGFLALAAWWRFGERRTEAQVVMWALLALHVLGYAIHIVYPTAPPWYVAQYGTGPAVATVPPDPAGGHRFDQLLHVTWFSSSYGDSSSVFGALPSLHVAQTFLAALFAWRFRSLRVVATIFFGLVFLSSVYLNHHYIVDGISGMAIAGIVFAVTARVLRRARTNAPKGQLPPALNGATHETIDDIRWLRAADR